MGACVAKSENKTKSYKVSSLQYVSPKNLDIGMIDHADENKPMNIFTKYIGKFSIIAIMISNTKLNHYDVKQIEVIAKTHNIHYYVNYNLHMFICNIGINDIKIMDVDDDNETNIIFRMLRFMDAVIHLIKKINVYCNFGIDIAVLYQIGFSSHVTSDITNLSIKSPPNKIMVSEKIKKIIENTKIKDCEYYKNNVYIAL